MHSPARLLRLHRYRRLLSSLPNPNPNPNPSPLDKPLSSLLNPIRHLHDPDALVSHFNISSSDPRFRHHFPIYDLAVRRLLSLRRPDAIQTLIHHQKLHPDFTASEPFAARLILLYGRAHLLADALSTFKSLKCPRTALSLNSLLTGFARSPDADPARIAALVQEIQSSCPEVSPNVVSYNIIISALCEKGQFEQALEILGFMENKGISPNLVTFNTLLHGFYSKGRFSDGEKIWERMEERDVRSYNSRLRGLVSEKRVLDAVKVFDEMPRVGVRPDVYSWNALIKGYCQDGMLEEAKKVYLGLEKNECEPDVVTFKTLIPVVLDAEEYEFVLRLCNEGINLGFRLDAGMLQRVVDGLAKEEMFDKAKKLVKHVRSKKPYGNKALRLPLPCLVA